MSKKISFSAKIMRRNAFRSTVSALVLAGVSFAVLPAFAATISVPNGGNLNAYTPLAGDIWNLQGNAFLSNGVAADYVKTFPTSLTINGVAGGSTITMNDNGGHYGSFSSTSNATVTLSNVTITGGLSGTSATIGTYNGASLTLNTSGTVIFSNNAKTGQSSGGGLYSNASMTINGGVTFNNNNVISGTNQNFGGGVFAATMLTFTDATQTIIVTNNSAYGGGGLNSGTGLSIAGGLLLDNNLANTSNGGGTRTVAGNASVAGTAGNVTVTRNRTTGGGANGGGMFAGNGNIAVGNSSGVVTIGGSAVNANTAAGSGGGIYSNGATSITGNTVTISYNKATTASGGGISAVGAVGITSSGGSVTLTDNTAGTTGGAIYSGSTVTISGSSPVQLSRNTTTNGLGGGIYALSNVEISPDIVMNSNTANGANAAGGAIASRGSSMLFHGNVSADGNKSSANEGGALYLCGGGTSTCTGVAAAPYALMRFDNPNATLTFTNNAASIWGGAIVVDGHGDLTIDSAAVTMTGNTAGNGGGAVQVNGNVSFTNTNGTVILQNNSAGVSGAIGSHGITTIAASTVTITGNKATSGNGGAITAYGTAGFGGNDIQFTNSAATITVSNNSAATYGGALAVNNAAGQVLINGANITVDANKALNGSGGAIYSAGSVTINNHGTVSLTNNTATNGHGGAIYTKGNVTSDGGALVITGNLTTGAAKNGGGIISDGGSISLNVTSGNVLIANNTAGGGGAGLYTTMTGSVTVGNANSTVDIENNFSNGGNGGAISTGGSGTPATTITGSKITLSGNTVNGGAGGVISSMGAVTLNGAVTADNNKALLNGGVVNQYTNGFTVNGSIEASGNSAGGSGGVVYLISTGNVLTTGDTSFTNNIAKNGNGGVISAGAGNVALASQSGGTMLSNNSATANGGAIYAAGTGSGNVVIGNASAGATISDNKATQNGGAIYASGAVTVTAGGATDFTNNIATNGKGGAIWAGGNVTLNATGGDMTFSGNSHGDPSANAVYFNNTAGGATATFNADAGRVITFYDPIQNNDANGVMTVEKTGAGMVSFDGSKYSAATDQWSKMFANTTVSAGTFEVANNAIYGALSTDATTPTAATSFTSAAGTMVQGGKVGTVIADTITLNGNVSIAGRHTPVNDFSVFNISTNALTLGGGTVYFNTYLDQGTPGNSDLLVLNLHGTATTGQSFINVANAGGNGAWTIGNGIKLVETNGSGTTAGAFVLGNRVTSGAYEYHLFYGGVDNDANDQNWYLRNVYTPPPYPPGCETTNSCVPQPPVPIIRPEVPVSMVIPPLALEYGYAMLDTLHERVGETYLHNSDPATEERIVWCKDPKTNFRCVVRVPVANANGAGKDETRWASSGWARLLGDRGLHQPDNFARRGPNYDYTFGGIQAGLDIYAREQADGTLDKAGIYVGYGQITSNVKGQLGGKAGSVDMDAYTLAGYWTHHSPQGWYTDAVVQGTWYSADAKSVYGTSLKPDGFGILGSLEGGYAFKLGSGFTLEPQAQIVYQNVSFDNTHLSDAFVRFDNGDSLRGRVGLRVTKTWNRADQGQEPRLVTAWLRANVWHEFLGKTKTSWGSVDGQNMTPFNTTLGGTWGEIGAGVTAQMSDKINIFATGAYNRSLDNKGREGWDGRLGMTVKW